MKEIKLANNKGIIFVDDEDYEWLNQYKWNLSPFKYAQTSLYINKKRVSKHMQKFLLNPPKGFEIDHIDHNKLNNQKLNLRIVTKSQNQMNNLKRKNTSSKYKGVYLNKNKNKWEAQIYINGKKIFLGLFINEDDAGETYNKAAKELFGEFANLNIIGE